MDQLDRIFQRLVHNIRSRNPSHVSLPFTVAELYEQFVPYRHNRRELGIETNQDYEVTVMRLLSGERGYLLGDAGMQEALRNELEARDPDVGAFREYSATEVSISPEALQQLGGAPRGAPRKPPAAAAVEREPDAAAAMAAEPPTATDPQAVAAGAPQAPATPADARPEYTKTRCRFCGGDLPEGREVKFCPTCGQNLAISRCPACGSDIEAGWRFCITCGREAEV